ncbi:MAG: alpha/beta hydrolase-fold protein [Bacteroidota bacterium]
MNSRFRTTERSDPAFESDGLRFITVKTPHLKGRGDMCVFVPDGAEEMADLPIYILLHGVYGSAWVWAMKAGAHRTARKLIEAREIQPAIVVMPSDGLWGDGSAYFAHHQKDFAQWIVEDVPAAVRENIAGSSEDSPLCIGGLSMGGFGALSLGSRFPEKFRAISGHSSITALQQMTLFVEEPLEGYLREAEYVKVIDSMQEHQHRLPAIRFDCGISDELIDANRLLHQQCTEAGIKHRYEEFTGGHEWPYWQKQVEKSFRFFDEVIYGKQ